MALFQWFGGVWTGLVDWVRRHFASVGILSGTFTVISTEINKARGLGLSDSVIQQPALTLGLSCPI